MSGRETKRPHGSKTCILAHHPSRKTVTLNPSSATRPGAIQEVFPLPCAAGQAHATSAADATETHAPDHTRPDALSTPAAATTRHVLRALQRCGSCRPKPCRNRAGLCGRRSCCWHHNNKSSGPSTSGGCCCQHPPLVLGLIVEVPSGCYRWNFDYNRPSSSVPSGPETASSLRIAMLSYSVISCTTSTSSSRIAWAVVMISAGRTLQEQQQRDRQRQQRKATAQHAPLRRRPWFLRLAAAAAAGVLGNHLSPQHLLSDAQLWACVGG